MALKVQLNLLIVSVLLSIVTDSGRSSNGCCVQTNGAAGLPNFMNYGLQLRILRHHQAVIPSYKFNCCGIITEWGVDVHPGGRGANERYDLNLQVWRPSPTVNNNTTAATGYYSLIGNNRFTSISLRDLVARVTPSPRDYIHFQPGDVLGIYVEDAKQGDDGVVVLTSDSYSSELVWYASITASGSSTSAASVVCSYSIGSDGVLNTSVQAAPVISISVCKYFILCATTVCTDLAKYSEKVILICGTVHKCRKMIL